MHRHAPARAHPGPRGAPVRLRRRRGRATADRRRDRTGVLPPRVHPRGRTGPTARRPVRGSRAGGGARSAASAAGATRRRRTPPASEARAPASSTVSLKTARASAPPAALRPRRARAESSPRADRARQRARAAGAAAATNAASRTPTSGGNREHDAGDRREDEPVATDTRVDRRGRVRDPNGAVDASARRRPARRRRAASCAASSDVRVPMATLPRSAAAISGRDAKLSHAGSGRVRVDDGDAAPVRRSRHGRRCLAAYRYASAATGASGRAPGSGARPRRATPASSRRARPCVSRSRRSVRAFCTPSGTSSAASTTRARPR